MGLLDIFKANGTAEPAVDGQAPTGMSGLMGKLNYGGIPFGTRLMAAAEALRSIENPNINRPGMALLARASEQAAIDRKAAAERERLQEKANMLADKLEPSNPELAASIRANPELVNDYAKGNIGEYFGAKSDARQRGYAVEDREESQALTREGWGAQADLAAANYQRQLDLETYKGNITEQAKMAEAARQAEINKGNMAAAKLIGDAFTEQTGVKLPPIEAPPAAAPAPIPAPIPGTVEGAIAPTPQNVPGLTTPEPAPGAMPQEEGDAPTNKRVTELFRTEFNDPEITDNDAAVMAKAAQAYATNLAIEGKAPDMPGAIQAASKVYIELKKARAEQNKADAAQGELDLKKEKADRTSRIETAATTKAELKKAQGRVTASDAVINSISKVKDAIAEDKAGESYLPATGAGSWMASFASETGARRVWNAVNTIKTNISFDRLQQMREESPTGGALGQVAIQELEMLQSVLGSLDPTNADFEDVLASVEKLYTDINQRNKDYAEDIKTLRNDPSDQSRQDFDELYGPDAHLQFLSE